LRTLAPIADTTKVWESEEQIQKWRSSADYKKAREIGDNLAKFRSYAVPGAAQ
jgi:heme-degrading monooxygenase HmoA